MARKLRLFNPEWNNLTDATAITKKDVHGKYPIMFHLSYWGAASDNATEIGGAADADKDGTTTKYQLVVVSSSANDDDGATKHVRAVAVIGISAPTAATGTDAVYSVEEFRMNGTSDVT